MTAPVENTPPAGGETPPAGTETVEVPQVVTAEDLAKVTQALEKERTLRKEKESALKEFQNQSRASMDETERKILEARESAAAEVRNQYGERLAQTEFKAAAAARNAEYDVNKALQYVTLSKFLGEDGEPDSKAIAAAVADLVPVGTTEQAPPSFDGGSRTSTPNQGPTMTQLIRQAAGRA